MNIYTAAIVSVWVTGLMFRAKHIIYLAIEQSHYECPNVN